MNDFADRIRPIIHACRLTTRRWQIVDFPAAIVDVTHDAGFVRFELLNQFWLMISSRDGDRIIFDLVDAKGKLRTFCARFARWASVAGEHQLNPYGDHGQFVVARPGGGWYHVLVDFMNTPSSQWIRIESRILPI